MAAFTIYRSSDGSAPTLTGETDSLCALLHACLVTGYGSQSAAGWSRPFDGASKSVFRPGAGSQFYLRVDDAGPGAATFQEARLRAYESMSDVDTGTNPFPTVAQLANGSFVRKSAAASSTARTWLLAADARTLYFFAQTGDVANTYFAFMFGDFYSYVGSDAYNAVLIGRAAENSASGTSERLDALSAITAVTAHTHVARAHTGLGASTAYGRHGDAAKGSATALNGVLALPNGPDSKIYLSPIFLHDPTASPYHVRGHLRGLYHFLHPVATVGDGDTFGGTGEMAGRSFLILKTSGNSGVYVLETSDTLDTNS
jgi:hypothetical protein